MENKRSSDTNKQSERANAKKYILIGVIVIAVLLIILSVIAVILGNIASNTREIPELDYDFYEPVENLNINDYPEYLAKDRTLYYMNEVNSSRPVNSATVKTMGDGPEFFYEYINAIKKGDSKAYNSLFDEAYLSSHGKKEDFTPQMIYDIKLKYEMKTEINADIDAITYSLEYCIYRNDGTFRRDIGSGSRKQFITVYFDLNTDEARIHSVKTEYNIIK